MTDRQYAVWHPHLHWRYSDPTRPDLSMDGYVPKEKQEVWANLQRGAKFAVANEIARRQQAGLSTEGLET